MELEQVEEIKAVCKECGIVNKYVELEELTVSEKIRIPDSTEIMEFNSRAVNGWKCEYCGKVHMVELLEAEDGPVI